MSAMRVEAEFHMAFINWKTDFICMAIVILSDLWAHTASGSLIVKPQDTCILALQGATLNCSTSLTEDVHWYFGTSYVYAGRKLYSPYNSRLKIEVYQNGGSTAFNLVFPSATPEDAGMYNCRDNQGRGETSSAEITVLTADGNGACQSNMKPDGVVIPNDCNVDPDEVQLSCSVTFYGKNPPQLAWKKVSDNGYSVVKTECQTTNNRIMCNASIVGDQQMNRSSFVCQTTDSSQLNFSLCTIPVKNLIYTFSGKTTTTSSVGNDVQCNPNTSQSCNYIWRYSDIAVSTSRTITPDRIGLYQCEAECNIRSKRCVVFYYAYINDDDSTFICTGYVVGICVVILLLVVTFVAAVYFFFLVKRMDRSRNENNLEFTSDENGTPQEETALMQPNEKMNSDRSRNENNLESTSDENGTPQEETALMQPNEKMNSVADEPELIRTLKPNAAATGNGRRAVFGLTILGDELFVLSFQWSKIEVFGDLQKLVSRREIELTGHQLELPWDIQSSSKHKCLYIVDTNRNEEQDTIVRIDLEGNVQKKWTTDCIASRLSVTSESNVIVTSLYKRSICEYSPDGDLIRLIELPSDVSIASSWHTLKRGKNEYMISHGNQGDLQHGVYVSDQTGNIKCSFGGKKGQRNNQLFVPVHMAAYSDGNILVADKDNHRVVLLSPKLKFLTALFSRDGRLQFPNRLCLDERNKRLFVSDYRWIGNMKQWNDGRVLVFDMSSVQTKFNINAEKNSAKS